MRSVAALAGVLLWCAAFAAKGPLEFGAGPAAATWQFEGSRTSCRLTHEIPDFGEARFVQDAGGDTGFDISAWRIEFADEVDVTSDTPAWLSTYPQVEVLGRVNASAAHRLAIGAPIAESMLRALYRGEQPRLTSTNLSVSMSAVSFRPLYESYSRCVAQLFPASFSQLERSSVAFAPERTELTDAAKARLDLIAEYVHADRSVTRLYVDGYADIAGLERKNRKLSELRARTVADYLAAAGCDPESIETRSHGSRFPVASNKTDEGRGQNRRTTIRLERGTTKLARR